MIREAIVKLVNKENLTYEMAEGAMDEIMGGKADPIQISAFLTAMTMKGETIEEITACANGMRKHGVHMEHDKDVLEIVGTGGDKSNSFNISTTASLVISAGGVAVRQISYLMNFLKKTLFIGTESIREILNMLSSISSGRM